MTIKLENFTATIDVQSVEVTLVNDNIQNKTASVDIVINGTHGGTLNGFTYTTSWEDSEVLEWVNLELDKFKV
tara:strand:- start:12402 stop:12620 length:219 start_codon:yes stop_codon:yes gene_type:complete